MYRGVFTITCWLGSATEGEKLVGVVYTCSLVLNLVPKLIHLVLARLVFTLIFITEPKDMQQKAQVYGHNLNGQL